MIFLCCSSACVEILLVTIEVVMSTLHMNKKYKALPTTGFWYIEKIKYFNFEISSEVLTKSCHQCLTASWYNSCKKHHGLYNTQPQPESHRATNLNKSIYF